METASGKETIIVLRRLLAYSGKIFQLSNDIVTLVSDRRKKPRISTAAVVKSSLVLFWARMGSSNAWAQVGRARFWQGWLGEPAFSADTLGRVHALLDAQGLRQGIHDVYELLKRNKALPDIYGLGVVVLDGHESHASYLRHCSGCLQRTIHAAGGDRIQFYHRQVTLLLLPGALPGRETVRLLLDHEPQRPGEDEVETALRLLARVIPAYPRTFDLVLADALYAKAPFLPRAAALTCGKASASIRAMAKVQKTSSSSSGRSKASSKSASKSKKKNALPTPPSQRGGVEMVDPLVRAQMKLYEEAMGLFHQQKFQRSKQELEKVLEGPSKELADRARTHLRIVEQRMKPSSEQNPKSPEEHYQRGVAMMNLGRWDEARESLEKARKLAPKADHIHYALAALDCLTGEADSAMANLKIAIDLRPANRFHARNDEDFAFLQEDPRFTELLYPEKDGYAG